MEKLRIDKWLWAARFYKTRSIATDEVNLGRVHLGGHAIKPAREVRAGDTLTIWQARVARTVVVKAISDQRGSATLAQHLYEETAESLELRAALAEQRRLSPEPALAIGKVRPTKRDRRDLQKGWGTRWSASVD
jgi:ribosome-associated heat shock protein Hsp15